jgi:hypothetical protein
MLRFFGMFGLAMLFLMISPKLRGSLLEDYHTIQKTVELYSPASYIGIGVLILAGLMYGLYRSSQPRV